MHVAYVKNKQFSALAFKPRIDDVDSLLCLLSRFILVAAYQQICLRVLSCVYTQSPFVVFSEFLLLLAFRFLAVFADKSDTWGARSRGSLILVLAC